MTRALDEYVVEGVPTTLSFHRRALRDERFKRGDLHTGFVQEMNESLALAPDAAQRLEDLAVIVAALAMQRAPSGTTAATAPVSQWKQAGRRRGMEQRERGDAS